MSAKWIVPFLFFGLHKNMVNGINCNPTISLSGLSAKPELDGSIRMECGTKDCSSGHEMLWKKWMLNENGKQEELVILYRYNTGSGDGEVDRPDYDLTGRTSYNFFDDVHTLVLRDLIIKDNGTWICTAIDKGNSHSSSGLNIIIPVIPKPDDITILPSNPPIVDGQLQIQFQCQISGVNPEPWTRWTIGGVENPNGESQSSIANDYWSVVNNVKLDFLNTGVIEVACTIGEGDDEWTARNTSVDVKGRAQIEDQGRDQEIQVDETFSFACEASGYFPLISWEKDGQTILGNDPAFTITPGGTSLRPKSTISSLALDPPFTCDNVNFYGGTYMCIARLNGSYSHSFASSDDMILSITYYPISGPSKTQEHGIGETNIILTCEVCASKVISDKWLLNGLDATDEELPDGSLSIKLITDSSFGNYTRVVTNALGTGICSVDLIHKSELDVMGLSPGEIAGIVIGCLIVAALIPLALILVKRFKTNKQKEDEEVTAYAESGNTAAANNVNPANGGTTSANNSAAPPVYAEVNKDKKKHTAEETTGPVYSEVNKSGRPLPKPKVSKGSTNTGPVYSEVNKPKQGRLTPIENHSRGGGGGEYEAVGGRPLPPIKHYRHYDNEGQRNRNDGLHYADVDFLKQGNKTKQSYGAKNPAYEPTEYAQIDHRKSAGIVV